MRHSPLLLLPLLACVACRSSSPGQGQPPVVSADVALRESLFAPLRALDGRWTTEDDPEAPMEIEYRVSSRGSVLREIMFPGTEYEMTNMYTLDGDGVALTHYCASGNQPHMRAVGLEGDRLVFRSTGVSDLNAPDEVYMGEMTLVFVDADHIEQHWTALRGGQPQPDQSMVMLLRRNR